MLYFAADVYMSATYEGAAMDAGRIEAGLATPWVGVIERVSFYSWHLWFIMLALRLSPKGSPTRSVAAA